MGGLGFVFLMLMFGLGGALVARVKGNSVMLWFLIAFLVPGAGLIAALLVRSEDDEPRRHCDGCGRILPVSTTLCGRCGTDLDYPEVTLPSIREELGARRRR